jgi:AcrR family transcriptional regulator
VTAPVDHPPAGQRARILDAALLLMSSQGSAGASMRQLAAACDLNVATIYHYFPSKADLLRSVLAERRYGERLIGDSPPLDPVASPRARLVDLLVWLWEHALEEEAVWRLLVGEGVRREPAASEATAAVVGVLTDALETWVERGFPEWRGSPPALARILRGQVFALVVEHLALAEVGPVAARARAEELAAVVFADDGVPAAVPTA